MANGKVTTKDVYEAVEDLREDIEKKFVSKDRFKPVEIISYGIVAIIAGTVGQGVVDSVIVAFVG